MSKTLTEIAQQLKDSNKKVQLFYAFNGMGKTRLSREFKQLIAPKSDGVEEAEDVDQIELSRNKILYYNAFTEDLFYWDNDLELDAEPKLKIQPNSFTDWILRDRGQDQNIIANFQRYTDDKLTPTFIEKDRSEYQSGKRVVTKTFPEVTFSFDRGTERTGDIKISKGEERNFIWSIFFTLLDEVIGILSEIDPEKRDDNQFDDLEYVFIDDPVSSLDDNHLIELAVDLARLIKSAPSSLKFIVTTHSPLFYNVLHNEFGTKDDDSGYRPHHSSKYRLSKKKDGLFELDEQPNDRPFSYHLFLMSELKNAIKSGQVRKYHFNFLRNVLEKTATFLGYKQWGDLLPKTSDGKTDPFAARIVNLSSHSAHAGEEVAEPEEKDKEKLGELVDFLINEYGYYRTQEEQHG